MMIDTYKKAHTFEEIDNAVRLDIPINFEHEFFTDFSDVRGDFEDKMIYRSLNVNPRTLKYNFRQNSYNKTLLFLAGMRGSGKTSELSKITSKLNHAEAFFCVTCDLDKVDDGLDKNDMEYMDILIFQLEKLVLKLRKNNIIVPSSILESMYKWYEERIKEVNKSIIREGGLEIEVEAKTPSLLSFLGLSAKLKSNLAGNKENAEKIRSIFKQNFTIFSQKFNEFIETVNLVLRKRNVAKEVLFIIDGLEKVATTEIRKKIIDEESNRIRQIKVSTIFTLPIELFALEPKLRQFSTIVPFPFVKIVERSGQKVEKAIEKFYEFVLKRVDKSLFDEKETVINAICHSGGSPRELLRIIEYAYLFSDSEATQITKSALAKAIKKLAAEYSRYISQSELDQLKLLKENNEKGKPTPFDNEWQSLLEKMTILEYNDGTYKRVHPLVEASQIYKDYVG
ncbi:MAG: hypothetical protein AAF960_01205 [Bacteroidota bacterium]